MTTTTFTDGVTVLAATWHQDINDHVYGSATVTWTYNGAISIVGTATLQAGAKFTVNVSSPGNGSIYKSASAGLAVQAVTGSSYDYALFDVGNSNYIMRVPTGTFNLETIGTVITAASTTDRAGLRLLEGVAPSAPVNGDMWQDGTNVKIRIGGATKTFTVS